MKETDMHYKIGQMFVVGFEGKIVPGHIRDMIHDHHIGGIILFSRNIGTPAEVLALTADLQTEARAAGYDQPLLICVDQENGVVRRLGEGTTVFPGSMALGATHNADNAYQVGLATGRELKALGINWNLAPVIDVNNNPNNPVIGVRSFGETPEKVANFGKAAMKGMQDAGIVTTLKHFPGYGDMDIDPHLDLPVISHDRERLDTVELLPFKECIETGADTIMSAHIYFPAIDDEFGLPATLSHKVITGLLRNELDFQGVVTTDCLEMNAISDGVGTERGAVMAIQAGIDLVMISHTHHTQINALQAVSEAVDADASFKEVIIQANQRINSLKAKYLQWEDVPMSTENPVHIDHTHHTTLSHGIYKASITIAKNEGVLPLKADAEHRILVIDPDVSSVTLVEDQSNTDLSLGKTVQTYHKNTDITEISDLTDDEWSDLKQKVGQYDYVVLGTRTMTPDETLLELVRQVNKTGTPLVVVALKNPYDIAHFPDAQAHICTYESTSTALQIAVASMFGEEKVTGELPVTISK